MIKYRDVSYKYGDKIILSHINLNVRKDDFTIIWGKTNSGKSSLIKLLVQEIEPSDGEIFINDLNIKDYENDFEVLYDGFEYMPQTIFLSDTLNVSDNILLINNKPKISPKDALEMLDSLYLLNKSLLLLNGYERRIVYLAALLTSKPDIIVFDEASGDLDYTRACNFYKLLKKLNDNHITIFATTKDERFLCFGKRIYNLSNSKLA